MTSCEFKREVSYWQWDPDQHSWRSIVGQVVKWLPQNSSSYWTISTRWAGEPEGRKPVRRDLISIPKVRAQPRSTFNINITITKAEGFLSFKLRRRSYDLILHSLFFRRFLFSSHDVCLWFRPKSKETDLKEGSALA